MFKKILFVLFLTAVCTAATRGLYKDSTSGECTQGVKFTNSTNLVLKLAIGESVTNISKIAVSNDTSIITSGESGRRLASYAVPVTRTITTSAPLSDIGDLSANRTLHMTNNNGDTMTLIDTNVNLTADSDTRLVSQKAIKAYADTKLALAGGTVTGAILLDDNASLQMDATADGMADDKYNGITMKGKNFGETCAQWATVFLQADAKFDNADADAAGEFPAFGICVAGGNDTDAAVILTRGVVRNEGWTGLTVGGAVYLADTAGGLTQTAPSASGDCIQIIGRALSDSEIYFNFSGHWLEVE